MNTIFELEFLDGEKRTAETTTFSGAKAVAAYKRHVEEGCAVLSKAARHRHEARHLGDERRRRDVPELPGIDRRTRQDAQRKGKGLTRFCGSPS